MLAFSQIAIPAKELIAILRVATISQPTIQCTSSLFSLGFPSQFTAIVKDVIYRQEFHCRLATTGALAAILFNNRHSQPVLASSNTDQFALPTRLPILPVSSCLLNTKLVLRFHLTALIALYVLTVSPCRCLFRRIDIINSKASSAVTRTATSGSLVVVEFIKLAIVLALRTPLFSGTMNEGRVR